MFDACAEVDYPPNHTDVDACADTSVYADVDFKAEKMSRI